MDETTMMEGDNPSPLSKASCVHSLAKQQKDRWDVDSYRQETAGNNDSMNLEIIGQIVASINQEPQSYLDSGVQSSPDSGVDMSSPDLKTGYLSSQEDQSPRIQDSFMHPDDGKPRPKYPDIGNIHPSHFNMYAAGTEQGSIDHESTPNWDVPCSQRDKDNGVLTSSSSAIEYSKNPVNINSEFNFPARSGSENHFTGNTLPTSISSYSADINQVSANEGSMKMDFTVFDFDLSETPASPDEQSRTSKNFTEVNCVSADDKQNKNSTWTNDDRVSWLNNHSIGNNSPTSVEPLTSLLSPPPPPQQQQSNCLLLSQSSVGELPSDASAPSSLKPSTSDNQQQSGDYLLEYQKFLQSCGVDQPWNSAECQARRSRRKLSQSRRINHSHTEVLFSRHKSEDRDFQLQRQIREHNKQESIDRLWLRQNHKSIPKRVTLTKWKNEAKSCSVHANVFGVLTKKTHKFNPRCFMKAEQKAMKLRRTAVKFLKAVFPNLDYPSPRRMLATVDVLLSQILDCLLDRKPEHVDRQLQVIPFTDKVKDVRIVICRSPTSCIRHLRRKLCQVIKAVLPHVDFKWLAHEDTDQVDSLLRYITRHNRVKKQ